MLGCATTSRASQKTTGALRCEPWSGSVPGRARQLRRYLILGILLYLRVTSVVLAQTATGVIRGTVEDLTGAIVTDVHVKLVDDARHQSWEQRSNQNGLFEFRALPFGNYRIELDHPGFKKAVIEDVALQVAQTVSVNVTLQVGSVTESITVQAGRSLLEASDASLSQVIDDKRLLELPINGRNVMQLVSLSAGVINGGRASATQRQANYGPGFSVGGQRDNTSVVLVDGMEISGQELNNYPLAIPPLDSLAEFRVQTSNYSAEFGGNSGAVINVASKRGSNAFHSTVFEFLRNDALDARNPFSATVDPLNRNQFGFVASGPVFLPGLYNAKDRLFWMFSYEGTRRRQAVTTTALVPTLKERAGDFSDVSAVIVDPFTKIPFPGNVIPAERINRVGAALANLYPAPNNADSARNYIGHPNGVSDNNVLAMRIDYRPGSRDAIWGRFTRNAPFDRGVGQALSPAFPGFDQEQSDNNLQLAFGNAHSFTPTTINEVNIGFVQFRRERRSVDAFTRNWIQELGIKGISPDPITWAAPSMTPSGYPEIGYSSNNAVFKWVTDSVQIVDNFSAVRARHTLKAGLTIQLRRMTTTQWGQPNGAYTFSGQFSAPVPLSATSRFNALADLLLGTFRVIPSRPLRFRHTCRIQTWAITYRTTGESRTALRQMWDCGGNTSVARLSAMTGLPVSILRLASRCFRDRMGTRAVWSILITKTSRPGSALPGAPAIAQRYGVDMGFSTPRMSSTRIGNSRFSSRSEGSAA